MKRKLSAFYLLVILFYSCSTDFDVIAPYKEVIVVDGLINAVDSVQYVKVSKAYLGEGNAYVMAQQSDSINYANVLDVKMERLMGNLVLDTFVLNRSELYDKDSGTFAYPFHILYKTNHPFLQDDSQYKIIVTNRQTGTTATSQTKIVKDVDIRSPLIPNGNPIRDSIDLASASNAIFNVIFVPGGNSKLYDFIIRFHYREIDPSGVSSEHSLDWNFSDKTSSGSSSDIIYQFYKYDLFYIIGANIPDKAGYIRRTDSLSPGLRPFEFIYIAGTEDLQTYYQLNQNSGNSVQEIPLFTTITNGIGLFTSRIIHSIYYYPNSVTEAAFDTSVSTASKNFQFH